MAQRANSPLGRRIQARMMRAINVPVRIVVGPPFATPLSGRLMLVFLTGGKTGKSPRAVGEGCPAGHDAADFGGGKWKRNLHEGRPERIRLRGRDVLARPELVSGPPWSARPRRPPCGLSAFLPVFCLGRQRAAWLASSGLIDAHQRSSAKSTPSFQVMPTVLSPVIRRCRPA